jgi:hypothetical protein
MDVIQTSPSQQKQKTSPPLPIFIDDVIDIQIMIKSIEKDINKEDHQQRRSSTKN